MISYDCGETQQSFSTMDSGRVHAGKPVRCPWCWTERGSSSLQQSRRISAPADMCTLAPLPRQSTHIFFFYSRLRVRGLHSPAAHKVQKKKKRKQAIIAMVCNTIHGTVKEAWEVNRIGCGGDCSPHVEKKNLKAFQVIVCSCISIQRRIQFDLRN